MDENMNDDNSSDENSDCGLQIVIENDKTKKQNTSELDETDRKIIESVEEDLEANLEEKAAKANLTAKNVKNIIKEVVTNEHVLALVKHVEDPDKSKEPATVYEPKFTRAKTKQLLSTSPQPTLMPWTSTPKKVSEVQKLFTEELQEDSSGDEYVPETPSKNTSFDSSIPDSFDTGKNDTSEANIALRTRSKLSLSHTPLEVIEESFIPPDITTDMYDMDCDDDVWAEFLKTFTRPLDEVTKAAEDEDHDPEYNILADEEIDEVDREELRADRAVNISKKELNCLIAELFEYTDIYESNKQSQKSETNQEPIVENNDNSESDKSVDSEDDPDVHIRKHQIQILAQQIRQHIQMLTHNFLLTYEHPLFSDMAFEFKDMLNDFVKGCEGKTYSMYRAINLEPAVKLIEKWENLFLNKDSRVLECKRHIEKEVVESLEAKRAGTKYIVTFPDFLMETIFNSEVFIYPNLLPKVPFVSPEITRCRFYFLSQGEENLIALFLEQIIPHLKQDSYHLTKRKKVNMQHVCYLINKLLMPNLPSKKIARMIKERKFENTAENPIKYYYRNKKAPPIVHYVTPLEVDDIVPPCKKHPSVLPLAWREYYYRIRQQNNCDKLDGNQNLAQVVLVSQPIVLQTVKPSNINCAQKVTTFKKILPKGTLPDESNCIKRRRRRKKKPETKKSVSESESVKENKVNQVVQIFDEVGNCFECEIIEQGQISVNQIEKETGVVEIVFIDQSYLSSEDTNKNIKMLPDMPSLGNTPAKVDSSQAETNNDKDTSANENKEQNLSFDINSFQIEFIKPNSADQVKRNFENLTEFSSSVSKESGTSSETSTNNEPEKDNPDDINELMKASCTVKSVTKKEPSGAEKKRAKIRREFIANLKMATPDDLKTQFQKEESFADAFFDKLRQTLTVEDYDKIINILGHYDEKKGNFLKMYNSVEAILSTKYKELSDEFLLFLTDIQAQQVGKLMPYFIMKDLNRFMKKLLVYFKDQPTQMKKIIKSLTELSEKPDTTMEMIKTTILPLLKGNAALTDWFLQIFPSERPPKILTSGPHELLDVSKELARQPDEDICETVILPDTEDPYGGASCICACHIADSTQTHFHTRSLHCSKCGLKFIQGKIYVQTGKALRPAVVSFLTNPEKDHTERLAAALKKRSETSPTKQVTSPHKEHSHDENRHNHENGVADKKKTQKGKTPRKQKVKDGEKTNTKESGKSNKESKASGRVKTVKNTPKRQNKKRSSTKKSPEYKAGSMPGQHKRLAEEQVNDVSEHTETQNDFECSQDVTNTESEFSEQTHLNSLQSNESISWTREEDKIILQAFKQSKDNEETFKQIAETLKKRTVSDIKNRFDKLMSLLSQMASNSQT